MNTQQNQNEIKKKEIQVNPSRDVKYDEKEKDFSGEFGEQIDEKSDEEVNPAELDNSEVELDRGGVEFGGGQEQGQPSEPGKPGQPAQDAQGMSSDLGGDVSQVSKH
jgi:hypothetical protein